GGRSRAGRRATPGACAPSQAVAANYLIYYNSDIKFCLYMWYSKYLNYLNEGTCLVTYMTFTGVSCASDPGNNIPVKGDYCVTNVTHQNEENHCASRFLVWKLKDKIIDLFPKTIWENQGLFTSAELAEILQHSSVYSARKGLTRIETGEKIEVEFRISHNDSSFPLSEMPHC
ncbi:hypothetical protein, partial [Gluconobacter oxydans]|uniref:hypothetical protein n=1 Tax=Gluconobacter oxydans TaxID=442 RepID=UPI0039EC0881